LAGSPVAARS